MVALEEQVITHDEAIEQIVATWLAICKGKYNYVPKWTMEYSRIEGGNMVVVDLEGFGFVAGIDGNDEMLEWVYCPRQETSIMRRYKNTD